MRSLELASHPMGWIVASHSIYNRDYASLAELAQERIITYSKNSGALKADAVKLWERACSRMRSSS